MKKQIAVEGMMCAHCSGRVKNTLESVAGVASASVSHEKGLAVVTLSFETPDEILKSAVEEQGYRVTDISPC